MKTTSGSSWRRWAEAAPELLRHPALPYVAPFAILMVLLGAAPWMQGLAYPVRTVAVAVALVLCSRQLLGGRAARPVASVAVGLAVFAIWVAPDFLFPGYRNHWLFQNALTGASGGAVRGAGESVPMLFFRTAGSALVVPPAEELFWRGWLMRWLISHRFEKVPLGAFSWGAFLITAVLFAAEHGPYWDVGLAAGLVYGAWMVKTRRLADCVLAHGVTNAALAMYVMTAGRWEYWL